MWDEGVDWLSCRRTPEAFLTKLIDSTIAICEQFSRIKISRVLDMFCTLFAIVPKIIFKLLKYSFCLVCLFSWSVRGKQHKYMVLWFSEQMN